MSKPVHRCDYINCQRMAGPGRKYCSPKCAAQVRAVGPKALRTGGYAIRQALASRNRMDTGADERQSWQAPSHIEGASWVSVSHANPLSDLERRALALWAPDSCIDRWPGKAQAIRNAVALELGNSVFTDDGEDTDVGPLKCPAHMVGR